MLRHSAVLRLARLSPVVSRVILSAIGGQIADSDPVLVPGETLSLLVAGLLDRVRIVSNDQRLLLLQDIKSVLWPFAQQLQEVINAAPDKRKISRLPVCQLGFVERRYVTATGRSGFLDLTTGDALRELPAAPLETISYNLTTLYVRNVVPALLRSNHADNPEEPVIPTIDSRGPVDG